MSADSTVIQRLSPALRDIPDVRLAYLFGSRAGRAFRADSDFDIAILLDEASAAGERGRMVRQLAARIGRVVSSAHVDLVILNDAPALLRQRILRDGTLLFERTPEDRVRFSIRAIREYQDFQIPRARATGARLRRLHAGEDDGRSRDLLEKARGVAALFGQAAGVPRS